MILAKKSAKREVVAVNNAISNPSLRIKKIIGEYYG
jgi:hypothetical protein